MIPKISNETATKYGHLIKPLIPAYCQQHLGRFIKYLESHKDACIKSAKAYAEFERQIAEFEQDYLVAYLEWLDEQKGAQKWTKERLAESMPNDMVTIATT